MKTPSVIAELTSLYTDALTHITPDKQDLSRLASLRCSALPFCPISFFATNAKQGRYRYLDMKGIYYTRIGSLVHEIVQTNLGVSGKLLADWRCPICRKWKRLTLEHECCDTQMEYHEVEVSYKGVVGHIDGIFKDSKGLYWIVDYKTTKLAAVISKMASPGIGYILQVYAYALLMELQYKIKIEGCLIFFIPRDDPKVPTIVPRMFNDKARRLIKTKLKKYLNMHRQTLKVKTKQDALALLDYGKCQNPYCNYCTKTNTKELLLEAWRLGTSRGHLPLSCLIASDKQSNTQSSKG